MIIDDPCRWIISRIENGTSFFSVRINDGEMIMMYRKMGEGVDTTFEKVDYSLGDALLSMIKGMSSRKSDCLIGCSWNTGRSDEMGRGPFAESICSLGMEDSNWCHEHWPLVGVIDGSTKALLKFISTCGRAVNLVTCEALMGASKCIIDCSVLLVPARDSYQVRDDVFTSLESKAKAGCLFIWAAGAGMKPTAWKLFQQYPQSCHIDVGHLFNGVFGLNEYGWLQRKDGPWYAHYFSEFAPWVRSFNCG